MEDLRASFALFDQDGDGHITTSELTAVMKCLGQNPTDAEILAIIKEVDAEVRRNGTIEFSEFVIAMAKSVNDIDAEKEIKEAFDVFDKDGNGHINVEELRYVSVNLGETFSDEDIAEMLKQADFDGDGVVNYKVEPLRSQRVWRLQNLKQLISRMELPRKFTNSPKQIQFLRTMYATCTERNLTSPVTVISAKWNATNLDSVARKEKYKCKVCHVVETEKSEEEKTDSASTPDLKQPTNEDNWNIISISEKCECAFKKLKESLTGEKLMLHFNPQLPVIIATDASPRVISSVILHAYPNGTERPITYASTSLRKAETHFLQIEYEALGIVFGLEKFHYYLFGRKSILDTDNKPLTLNFGENRDCQFCQHPGSNDGQSVDGLIFILYAYADNLIAYRFILEVDRTGNPEFFPKISVIGLLSVYKTNLRSKNKNNNEIFLNRKLFQEPHAQFAKNGLQFYLEIATYLCPVQEIWGGMYSVSNFIEQGLTKKMVKKDGNYTVCFAETVAPPKTGCLVYSFGIRFEWEFEEKAEEFGCDVFAFDPSMGVASHRHSLKIFFYNQGLSNFDGVIQKGHQYWKMATFSSLLKQNNHTHSTIHILKIDVEGSEHEAIPDMIRSGNLNNVCQILLEIHNFAGLTLEKYYDLYWLLYKQEFVSVAVEEWNHADCSKKKKIGGHEIYCFVFTFINLRFL
ncbi:hypothetical protein QYM36_001953 [Artemia franciscana]|uniref:EF-hand domain-containing protein n=1 Tax=Artemia franciscana TaxID=6661 RepID=A0AA88I8M3_ARTSF|nr:hypothetical protein QYM36_001953 [Artemia franciscana]KAK2723455.1 hypothetical protein QYM36_001953 [Artemia franciscana]